MRVIACAVVARVGCTTAVAVQGVAMTIIVVSIGVGACPPSNEALQGVARFHLVIRKSSFYAAQQ